MELVPGGDQIFNRRVTCLVLQFPIAAGRYDLCCRLTGRYLSAGCSCCHLVGDVMYIDIYIYRL